jgi:DNA-binding MarR family transcriptional regulator
MNDTVYGSNTYSRPLSQAIDFLMAHFRLQGLLDELIGARSREYGLATTEALALMSLTRGTATISGVSTMVGVKKSTGSVMVDRLRARKLIRRQRSRRDHRVVTVELTEAGHDIARALCAHVPVHVIDMLSSLPEPDVASMIGNLARISGTVIQDPPAP